MRVQPRVVAGIPTGGQFKAVTHQAPDVSLREPRPSSYQEFIREYIGSDEPEMIALVEEFMRMEHSTLDGLSPTRFRAEARIAHRDVLAWASNEYPEATGGMSLKDYCQSASLRMPPSLQQGGK